MFDLVFSCTFLCSSGLRPNKFFRRWGTYIFGISSLFFYVPLFLRMHRIDFLLLHIIAQRIILFILGLEPFYFLFDSVDISGDPQPSIAKTSLHTIFNGYITYLIRMLNTHRTRIQKSCIFLCYHRYPNLLPVFFNVRFGWDIECHFCLVNFIYSDGIYHHTLQNSTGNGSGIFSLPLPYIILLFTLGIDNGNSCLIDQLRPHVDHPHVRWFVLLLHNLV